MNSAQQKFLMNRLDEAKRKKPSLYGAQKIALPLIPPQVKRARLQIETAKKIVAAWDDHCDKVRKAVTGSVDSSFYEAKRAILFSETPDAIKAIEKFERMKF
jgi:hypothetical protein